MVLVFSAVKNAGITTTSFRTTTSFERWLRGGKDVYVILMKNKIEFFLKTKQKKIKNPPKNCSFV